MIQDSRVRRLCRAPERSGGRYVLYWMQQSQREHYNHALEYAVGEANRLKLPLLVFFGLTPSYPHANRRHYRFLLEGLEDVGRHLAERGIHFAARRGDPVDLALELGSDASLVVVDRGYLRIQRSWRRDVAERLDCPLIEVESDLVVPVDEASPKEEYSAGTFRPKIRRQIIRFLEPVYPRELTCESAGMDLESLDLSDIDAVLDSMDTDDGVSGVGWIRGGTSQARARFERFIKNDLEHFADRRNDPSVDLASSMSPYLHFGHISALSLVLAVLEDERMQDNEALVRRDDGLEFVPERLSDGAQSFLEELIVRRELAMNFVRYNERYDEYEALPGWALATLAAHRGDERAPSYSLERLEAADTHDEYWNAAQTELLVRGKMHGYMRMYWGKKIIEWTDEPSDAFKRLIYLNDRYHLDGRDANGYAGVAWCFGKHDRAWKERPIFGKLRYMNDRGLERKFDIQSYVRRVRRMKDSL